MFRHSSNELQQQRDKMQRRASIGWYSVMLLTTAYPYINKTGTTQFRLRFKLDDDNDNTADYMKFFSGNYGTATDRPVLVIEYYVP